MTTRREFNRTSADAGAGTALGVLPGELEWRAFDGLLDSHDGFRPQGTINCDVVDRHGDLSPVTTTSGLSYKIPVGDWPIIGAGQFCDNDVGAADRRAGARRSSRPAGATRSWSSCGTTR